MTSLRPLHRPLHTLHVSLVNPPRSRSNRPHNKHPPLVRPLHSASVLRAEPTHYDILSLPPTASPADIKKQFYALSKQHHPDLNRNNPDASQKFVAISDAYNTLGDPVKRERYDRDHLPRHSSPAGPAAAGSYHSGSSTGPGSRKASGLSRRRTPFRGPPPSFYRAGGWGANGAKRSQNAYYGQAEPNLHGQQQQQGPDGDGKDWPFNDPNDVPHFDRDGHFKQTSTIEQQMRQGRRRRRTTLAPDRADGSEYQNTGVDFKSFVVIGGVLLTGVTAPFMFFGRSKDSPR